MAAVYLAAGAKGPPAIIPQTCSREVSTSDEEQETNPKHTKTVSSISGTLNGFVADGRKQVLSKLKEEDDNALLLFIVCNTLPPNIIDSREFKHITKVLNSDYVPASATTFADKLVLNKSAKVNTAVIAYLKTCWNLTIMYDGGKI